MIRKATLDDAHEIVALGYFMAKESPEYRDKGYDFNKLYGLFNMLVTNNHIVLVVEKETKIVGFLVTMTAEYFFSQDKYVTELAVYLAPEHRHGMDFIKMVRMFEREAAAQGIPTIKMGVSTGNEVGELYSRIGYTQTGTVYQKTLGK